MLAVGAELKHTFALARAEPRPRRAAHRRPGGPAHLPGLRDEPGAPAPPAGPRAGLRGPRPAPGVPLHAVRRARVPGEPPHRRAAPPRPRGLGRGGGRPDGRVHRRRVRRAGHGRRRHVLGRRGARRHSCHLPAGGAVRAGADARRRAGDQEAVPHGAGLPAGGRGVRTRREFRRFGAGRSRSPTGCPRRPLEPSSTGWTRARSKSFGCSSPAGSTRPRLLRPGGSSMPPPACSASATSSSSRPRPPSSWSCWRRRGVTSRCRIG